MNPNPYDTRDELEHAEVAALLAQLPAGHPARDAYGRGTGTIELTHLVADRAELVEGLKAAYLSGWRRVLTRSRGFRP
jgi:hypothetical protein